MISYDDKSGIFKLTTANTAYAFQIVGGKYPVHLYYGLRKGWKNCGKEIFTAHPSITRMREWDFLPMWNFGKPLVRGVATFGRLRLGFQRRTALAISFSPLKIILPHRESPNQ